MSTTTLTGRELFSNDGNPIIGADVHIYKDGTTVDEPNSPTVSDADGKWSWVSPDPPNIAGYAIKVIYGWGIRKSFIDQNVQLQTINVGAGHIKGGQTAYNTGTGFFLGYSTDKYKFSIGDATTNYVTWDGTTLAIGGTITATAGTIGGFTVTATALYAGSVATRIQLDTTSGIHLGATAFADAPFRVSLAGALVATSATITGAITATSGFIGGFAIGATDITGGGITLHPSTVVAYIALNASALLTGNGAWFAALNTTAEFRVGSVAAGVLTNGIMFDQNNLSFVGVNTSLTAAGVFTAANAVITGAITASSGSITGDLTMSGSLAIGATPATVGALRLSNNDAQIYARNALNTANVALIALASDNTIVLGAQTRIGALGGGHYQLQCGALYPGGQTTRFLSDDTTGFAINCRLKLTDLYPGNQTTYYLTASAGGLGFNVAPPASTTGYTHVGVGAQGMIFGASTDLLLGANIYRDTDWKKLGAGKAAIIDLDVASGAVIFYATNTGAGAAGDVITLAATLSISAIGDTVVTGTLTVNGNQTGAADHVFDAWDDMQLLRDWRAGTPLPFATGDILNRDRLLRDTIIGLERRVAELEART